MTEVPKIVHDRLRAALPERGALDQAHPDADQLTAFAEQALPVSERDGVLEHLALCMDCREVVVLALPVGFPDAGMVAAPVATDIDAVRATVLGSGVGASYKLKFAWPRLRWAVLAAGVAAVAAVLLVGPGKLNRLTLPSAQRIATTAQPVSSPQIASSSVPSSAVASSRDQSTISAQAVSVRPDTARAKSELRPSKKNKAGQAVPLLKAESGMLLASNGKDSGQAGKPPSTPSARAQVFAFSARPGQGVTESVEVAGASEVATVESSTEGTQMARNDAPANYGLPIVKAKPAPQETTEVVGELQKTQAVGGPPAPLSGRNVMSAMRLEPSTNKTLADNVAWAIKAGTLQRSLDSGQSWQSVLHTDHPLLCYASHGAELWAGGQTGTLFHSVDSGITWVQIQPFIKSLPLSSDITHIDIGGDVTGPAKVILFTSTNEIWSSADGGRTWEKKTGEKK